MNRSTVSLTVVLAVLVTTFPTPASAQLPNLADITGINIDLPNRRVSVGAPENPFSVIERTGQAIVGAPARQFILAAKANAGPTQPIPPAMYQQLASLGVRRDLLDRARWSTNWRAVDTVFTADAAAVALEEVIVFRNASDVYNNPVLWVHELKHFEQYDRMGLDRFASEYTVNRWVYENEATDAENRAAQMLRARNAGGSGPMTPPMPAAQRGPFMTQPAPQSAYYSYCATPVGNSPVIQGGLPPGASCSMPTPWGPAWGTVVGFNR